jgi:hypothetical protein
VQSVAVTGRFSEYAEFAVSVHLVDAIVRDIREPKISGSISGRTFSEGKTGVQFLHGPGGADTGNLFLRQTHQRSLDSYHTAEQKNLHS